MNEDEKKILDNLEKYFPEWTNNTIAVIKQQFKKNSLEFHPDKNHGQDTEFKEMKACYDILQDPEKSALYRNLASPKPSSTRPRQAGANNFTDTSGFFSTKHSLHKQRRAQPTQMSEKTEAELKQKFDKEYKEYLEKMSAENPEASRVPAWKREILQNKPKRPFDPNPSQTTGGDTQTQFFPDINNTTGRKRRAPINPVFLNQEKDYQNVESTLEQIKDLLNQNSEQKNKINLLEKLDALQKKILIIRSQYTFTDEQKSNLQKWKEEISKLISKINSEVQTNNSDPTPTKKPPTKESENLAAELLNEEELFDLLNKRDHASHQQPETNQPTKADRMFDGLDDPEFNKTNSIMKAKGIQINHDTQSALTKEQIIKIKQIFATYSGLKKLPRNTLINKKITEIQYLLYLYKDHTTLLSASMSEKKQNLENMLEHYKNLQNIMKKHNLNLPYSINKQEDSTNHTPAKLYVVYHTQLGEKGAFGRVKLAQDLETGKVLAAKIQYVGQQDTSMDLIERESIVLKALDRYWGQTSRKELYIKKQDGSQQLVSPTVKVKNTMFSDFVEGITLHTYLVSLDSYPKNQDIQLKVLNAFLAAFQELKLLDITGIVHGDLHLGNIQIFPDLPNNTSVAKLLDFGISTKVDPKTRIADIRTTYWKDTVNTYLNNMSINDIKQHFKQNLPWVAPEFITQNFVNSSADIYSLGQQIKSIKGYFSEPLNSKLLAISNKMTQKNPNDRINIDECIRQFESLIKEIQQPNPSRKNPWHR